MPDIRAFFTPKGGAAPPKPVAAKPEPPAAKGKRGSELLLICKSSIDAYQFIEGRKVVEDSDDEAVEYCRPPFHVTAWFTPRL